MDKWTSTFDHRSAPLSGGCEVIKAIVSGALSVSIIKTYKFDLKHFASFPSSLRLCVQDVNFWHVNDENTDIEQREQKIQFAIPLIFGKC